MSSTASSTNKFHQTKEPTKKKSFENDLNFLEQPSTQQKSARGEIVLLNNSKKPAALPKINPPIRSAAPSIRINPPSTSASAKLDKNNKKTPQRTTHVDEKNYDNKEPDDDDDEYEDCDDNDRSTNGSNIDSSESEEQEDANDYCKGGYYHVKIGETYNNRYNVLRKVGWGHFSTVWLCWDIKGSRYVALKVVKSAKHYTETALDEIKLLKTVRDTDPYDPYRLKTVQLYDDFKMHGPNGTHVCMVFEVLGNNLLKLITKSNYTGIPLENVRIIVKQVLEALDYLHTKCKIIHTDLKPENVLMCVNESDTKKLADEAIEWVRSGTKPPASATSTLSSKKSVKTPASASKMSKNKKKKLKKKEKHNQLKLLNEKKLGQDLEIKQESEYLTAEENFNSKKANDSEEPTRDEKIEKESPSTSKIIDTLTKSSNSSISSNNSSQTITVMQPQQQSQRKQVEVVDSSKADSKRSLPQNKNNTSTNSSSNKHPFNTIFKESELQVKIADLGNACWSYQHFTEDIQTRQYRSLEVIIGAGYDCSSDMWSLACMAFELATGDYLFEPHSGEYYSRDEDHLAHIIELLGHIPKSIALSGKFSREFFNKRGELSHIGNLRPWSLYSVLTQKYSWSSVDAKSFSDFLIPMLNYDTKRRATAFQSLNHPWILNEIVSQKNRNKSSSSMSSSTSSSCSSSVSLNHIESNRTKTEYHATSQTKNENCVTEEEYDDVESKQLRNAEIVRQLKLASSNHRTIENREREREKRVQDVDKKNKP